MKSFVTYVQLLLQIKQMIYKDIRLQLIGEILSSIKVCILCSTILDL